jgi:hypothetical protein
MIKDNVKPSTASRLLHQMEDLVYDPNTISSIIAKAQKTWLSDRGINTKAASAQVLLHDPETPLTGGAKKGRPKKLLQ